MLQRALGFLALTCLVGGAANARAERLAQCPDVPAVDIARLKALRTTELNRVINAGYAKFAQCFQAIAEGNPPAGTSVGKSLPVWYAFAPYASRVVGASEHGLTRVLASISSMSDLRPSLGSLLDVLALRPLRNFVEQLISAMAMGKSSGNLGALTSPKILENAVRCVGSVLLQAPSSGLLSALSDKATAVARTLLQLLEDGNRRIYSDIGGAGAGYLRWRAQQTSVDTPAVLGFAATMGGDAAKAKAVYDYAVSHLADANPPTSFAGPIQRDMGATCRSMLPAGFALYEEAGKASGADRDRRISFANNLLAHCEQHDAVQPAFTPGRVLAGEVDRVELMRCMTPMVRLLVRNVDWTFANYCKQRGLDITTKNWGQFADRWSPILDSFKSVYRTPSALWPMPQPDASQAP